MEGMNESIGFAGLGNMGQPMARNLLKAGYQLRAYNRDARKAEALVAEGAQQCTRPSDVVVPGGIVITMISDDAALENVTLGELHELLLHQLDDHLKPGHGLKAIVMGGSYASGSQRPDSDIDIGLYYNENQSLDIVHIRSIASILNDAPNPTSAKQYRC